MRRLLREGWERVLLLERGMALAISFVGASELRGLLGGGDRGGI